MLRTGGVFFFDTVNRTRLSRLVSIKLGQEWRWTRFLPPNLHDWHKFIKPEELATLMRRSQLAGTEMKGMSPQAKPPALLLMLLLHKRGKLSFNEMGRRMHFQQTDDLASAYMGYALKESG